MNQSELNKILEDHKIWVESFGQKGVRADLRNADLRGADLSGADLRVANLSGADLPDLTFIIYGEVYFVSISNGESVRAGCQCHSVKEWFNYSKIEIAEMDGKRALKFYPRLLDIINFYVPNDFEKPEWIKGE